MPRPDSLELDLGRVQGRFWQLITARDGVDWGLKALEEADPSAAPLSGWICAGDEDDARARLGVYADMYFFRLLDALESDVPRVAQWLGEDAFRQLVTDYLLVHPSRHPSLRHAADALPGFIAAHPLAEGRGQLADLARLELARNDVFDASASSHLEAQALLTVPPEAWPRLHLHLTPSVRWLRVCSAALPTWRALAEGRRPPEGAGEMTGCVVWRSPAPGRDDEVWHRTASLRELEGLDAIAAGEPFASVCERLTAEDDATPASAGGDAPSARVALQTLSRWLGDGVLSGLDVGGVGAPRTIRRGSADQVERRG